MLYSALSAFCITLCRLRHWDQNLLNALSQSSHSGRSLWTAPQVNRTQTRNPATHLGGEQSLVCVCVCVLVWQAGTTKCSDSQGCVMMSSCLKSGTLSAEKNKS